MEYIDYMFGATFSTLTGLVILWTVLIVASSVCTQTKSPVIWTAIIAFVGYGLYVHYELALLNLLIAFGAYYVTGFIVAFIRSMSLMRKCSHALQKCIDDAYEAWRHSSTSDSTQYGNSSEWWKNHSEAAKWVANKAKHRVPLPMCSSSYLDNASWREYGDVDNAKLVNTFVPAFSRNRDTIYLWAATWPFSLLHKLTLQLSSTLVTFIVNRVEGMRQKYFGKFL